MNALASYFQETAETPSALARRLGRSPSTITRLLKSGSDGRRASVTLAKEIEAATNGKVKASDVLGLRAAPEPVA